MSVLILRKFPVVGKISKQAVEHETLKQSKLIALAQKGIVYQVVEQETKRPPKNLVLRRKGKSLLVVVDDQVVLELEQFFDDPSAADRPAYLIDDQCLQDDELFDRSTLQDDDLVTATSQQLQNEDSEFAVGLESCEAGLTTGNSEVFAGLSAKQLLWAGLGLLGAGGAGAMALGGSSSKSPAADSGNKVTLKLNGKLAAESDSGTQGDNITNDATPTITGTATPGATIEATINGKVYTAKVAADGTYSLTIPNSDALPSEIFKLVVASVKLFRLLFYSNGLAPVAG